MDCPLSNSERLEESVMELEFQLLELAQSFPMSELVVAPNCHSCKLGEVLASCKWIQDLSCYLQWPSY